MDQAVGQTSVRPRGNGALSHPLPAGMRDLLPTEAARQLELSRTVLDSLHRFGYEPVSVPPFEYAEVLEQDMGTLDPTLVLRFVEPETGEVVALRPDMTPQVARLVATRLADAPPPLRLCYEGAVVRRRAERARRERQIQQAGFELVGLGGPTGDLEVLTVAASAVRAAGLSEFTLDLGHAMVSGSLIALGAEPARAEIVAALAAKDGVEARRAAERAGIGGRALAALSELPSLFGGEDVWRRAEPLLSGTPAEAPARDLRALYEAAREAGLAPNLVVDLGETWNFAYYTGMMFQVLADGPGEPIGSGGRYDRLFDRFGTPRPAAGFAVDLGNLGWALERSRVPLSRKVKVLVIGPSEAAGTGQVLSEFRRRGISCALGPDTSVVDYARAWRYSHVVELCAADIKVTDVDTGADFRATLSPSDEPVNTLRAVVERLMPPWEVR
jgi:ATP phosphoribosyltransferase regulatory subunit